MTVSAKHKFQTLKPDGSDATFIRASNWNDEHDIELASERIVGRTALGPGPAQELAPGTGFAVAGGELALDPAAARTELDLVPDTRDVAAGTGLTGGGTLDADRTLEAVIASQIEAETGTDNTVLMTPLRTAEGIAAALGYIPKGAPKVYTAPGAHNYTPAANVRAVFVEVVGGGGAGGMAGPTDGSGGTTHSYAGGGGGGGYAAKFIQLPSPLAGYYASLTVGAGGAFGSADNGSGSSYEDFVTPFSLVVGNGGLAGGSRGKDNDGLGAGAAGGAGGGASGGDINIPGDAGEHGQNNGSGSMGYGGAGGDSVYGAGGRASVVSIIRLIPFFSNNVGDSGEGYGGGGSGAGFTTTTTSSGGGGGANGIVIIHEYI
jgi:hypothetical protein